MKRQASFGGPDKGAKLNRLEDENVSIRRVQLLFIALDPCPICVVFAVRWELQGVAQQLVGFH